MRRFCSSLSNDAHYSAAERRRIFSFYGLLCGAGETPVNGFLVGPGTTLRYFRCSLAVCLGVERMVLKELRSDALTLG